jgi:uncharacterized membrane protein YqjE
MDPSQPKPGGLVDAIRRIGDTALALIQNRLQLFAVEVQEEKYRLLQAIGGLLLGVMLIFLGMVVGMGALAYWVWQVVGVLGVLGLCLLLLLAGVAVIAAMWNRIKSAGTPFSGSIGELKKDREWLQRKN